MNFINFLLSVDKVADVKSNASEKSEPEPEKKIDESAEPVRLVIVSFKAKLKVNWS